jgi:hypothetical protein
MDNMENSEDTGVAKQEKKKRLSRPQIFFLVVLISVITSILTVWLGTLYFFPKKFRPVELSRSETQALQAKIERLDPATRKKPEKGRPGLAPEKYTEDAASRHISFTERELNGLLAKNTDLAEKLAIDLSDDLASARLIIPLDPDLPILGGETLKLNAGLELRYEDARPVVMLRGISLWGVPMPNSWLGGIKNVDLVKEFGGDSGFWKSFADGIEYIRVQDGILAIQLKE